MVTVATSPEKSDSTVESAEYRSVASLTRQLADTADLSEEQRRRRLSQIVTAELTLPAQELRLAMRARLEAFLRLEDTLTKAAVDRIVNSLEAVMDELPGALAMRRVEFVQTIARRFPADLQERLRRLVPGVLDKRPANRSADVAGRKQTQGHWWQRGH